MEVNSKANENGPDLNNALRFATYYMLDRLKILVLKYVLMSKAMAGASWGA